MFNSNISASPSSSPQSNHAAPHAASPQRRPDFMQEEYWNQSITLRTILNAVVLDEWLKELAALAEEHGLRLTTDNYEDSAYVRSVALWLKATAPGNRFKKKKVTFLIANDSIDTPVWYV